MPVSITKELLQSGAQSATWFVEATETDEMFLNQSDFAALPSGKLKDVLTATYANDEAFIRAFATAGGSMVPTTRDDNNVPVVGLSVDGDDKPLVRLYFELASAIGQSAFRISVAYSASE